MVLGRSALDLPYFTERICGICSSAHALTASLALEQALGIAVPPNGQLLRNLNFAADVLQNHISHFYLLAAPDYFRGPDIAPFLPHQEGEYRLSENEETQFAEHYFHSFDICRYTHAAFTILGGKAPHGHGIVPGGSTADISYERISSYKSYLNKVNDFIENIMIPDIELLFQRYPEMIDEGEGPGNYLSFGGFFSPIEGGIFSQGVVIQGKSEAFDEKLITEEVTTAWYKQHPALYPANENTEPDRSQAKGYSWVKAPRYRGYPMEMGPLARAIIAGDKVPGRGALSRLWARTHEAKKIASLCFQWLEQLNPGAPALSTKISSESGVGVGLHEVMRGSLGHWVAVEDMRITHCQIVTPSAWNFSSRDSSGNRSACESALLNTKYDAKDQDFQKIGAVIRSFDPCFSCTVHLIENDNLREFAVKI